MRFSLAVKLTLAFLAVGISGALLLVLLLNRLTATEFNRFVSNSEAATVARRVSTFYEENGTLEGLESAVVPNRDRDRLGDGVTLSIVDAEGQILYGPRYGGGTIARRDLARGLPIVVEGETIGWVIPNNLRGRPTEAPAEQAFLTGMNRAVWLSALGAVALALVLGALLARNLTRPIMELTAATRAVAQGELGHRVTVHSDDELGTLARSFNQMSGDLARATTLRKQMTADIAHDLRTPLSIILGYTEALSDGKLAASPETYQILHEEAQHLSHLIDDLRTLSLADAGELPLTPRPIEPQALLERAATAHAAHAASAGIALQVESSGPLPEIEVDPERMIQVLGNLVSNALRHTPDGGRVRLAAAPAGDGVTLTIEDSGEGIAPEDLPHIFDRFYRADRARAQSDGASGLGLAIARSIVEAHGGTIGVASTPGRGATFTVRLPERPV